mmetsp:Transcript_709/g.1496  ORF Transcript_709/g.1496 Transcript_709/m.1496 type:complete len:173 (-) Transcript_709:206-724(-)
MFIEKKVHTLNRNTAKTMSFHYASKTFTTLKRLRSQLEPYEITPVNSEDEADLSASESNHNDKDDDSIRTPKSEQQTDLYAPLSPEEADEDQLAEILTTLDMDASFGSLPPITLSFDMDEIVHAESSTRRDQPSKRRRLSHFFETHDETDDDNETYTKCDEVLRRNQRVSRK